MITEKDLVEAIAECQGTRNPNAATCMKLASFYTILDHMKEGREEPTPELPAYSYAPPPMEPIETSIKYNSDTEFSWAISGKDPDDVWPIMDELMSVLQVTQPRLYDGVMRKLQT